MYACTAILFIFSITKTLESMPYLQRRYALEFIFSTNAKFNITGQFPGEEADK